MKISVITVCYNDAEHIDFTLKSILNQTYAPYEIIVCDGGSTDDTYERVLKYKSLFENRGIRFYSQSVKDGGIYFGMNYGLEQAAGDYCIFMNCGDRFHSGRILSIVNSVMEHNEADVYYGDCIMFNGLYKKRYRTNVEKLRYEECLCHQASFIRLALLKERKYNTEYSSAADLEYWFYLLKNNAVFFHMDNVIADYRMGGTSVNKTALIESEQLYGKYLNDGIFQEIPQNTGKKLYRYTEKNAFTNLGKGWAELSSKGVWSSNNESVFYYSLQEAKNICLLILANIEFGYSNDIYVNDRFLCRMEKRTGLQCFSIDSSYLIKGINKFAIRTNDEIKRLVVLRPEIKDERHLNIHIAATAIFDFKLLTLLKNKDKN